jgi:crotonobetainyl-CoA:carnitine CoA-transferase CaiB-like acyl-CoA transferase
MRTERSPGTADQQLTKAASDLQASEAGLTPELHRAIFGDDFAMAESGPLAGILVLDLSRTLAGPFCTMVLGDMGATVVKIEQPGRGDPARGWPPFVQDQSTYFLSVNRNKRSVTLDLRQAEGQHLLVRMAKVADVFVENFKVGSLARYGLDFETLHAVNPRLVYCSITGYGQTGPRRHEAGFDLTVQAESGIMDVTGQPDGPPTKAGVPLTDVTAGLYASLGILAALRVRDESGVGQRVDVALFDSALSLLTFQAASMLGAAAEPRRMGNLHPSLAQYEVFDASDASFALGIGTDDLWKRLRELLESHGAAFDEALATNSARIERRETLHARLQQVFAVHPLEHWLPRLRKQGIPCGAINPVGVALSGEQAAAREMVQEIDDPLLGPVRHLGIPVKLSATPGSLRRSPPRLGEHNEEVYGKWFGLSDIELQGFASRRVI